MAPETRELLDRYLLIADEVMACNRLKYGTCQARACAVRGGYEGGPFNPDISTCTRYQLQLALDSEG